MGLDKNDRITQLIEINRALAHDLDMSRRFASDLGRERDALSVKVEELSDQIDKTGGSDRVGFLEQMIESMKNELTEERLKYQQMQRRIERDIQSLSMEHDTIERRHEKELKELVESQKAMNRVLLRFFDSIDTASLSKNPWVH